MSAFRRQRAAVADEQRRACAVTRCAGAVLAELANLTFGESLRDLGISLQPGSEDDDSAFPRLRFLPDLHTVLVSTADRKDTALLESMRAHFPRVTFVEHAVDFSDT